MNDVVVPWCRSQSIEVTRSRAYKKNDQAFVEQKNGAVVRRLVGYGRYDGVETARVMARLYAAARLHVNFFLPSFKLKEKRREDAKVSALAHPKLPKSIKRRLRETYRTLDPVALLAEMRRCQDELGQRIDARGIKVTRRRPVAAASPIPTEVCEFARTLGATPLDTIGAAGIEPRATHRKPKRRYKTRVRMPSKLDPHLATIEGWLAAEPDITAVHAGRTRAIHAQGRAQPTANHRSETFQTMLSQDLSMQATMYSVLGAGIAISGTLARAPSNSLVQCGPPPRPRQRGGAQEIG